MGNNTAGDIVATVAAFDFDAVTSGDCSSDGVCRAAEGGEIFCCCI